MRDYTEIFKEAGLPVRIWKTEHLVEFRLRPRGLMEMEASIIYMTEKEEECDKIVHDFFFEPCHMEECLSSMFSRYLEDSCYTDDGNFQVEDALLQCLETARTYRRFFKKARHILEEAK